MLWSRAAVLGEAGVLVSMLAISSAARAADAVSRPARDVIPADEVTRAPVGFHPETRPRWGFVIGGSVVSAMGGLMLGIGLEQRADWNARPATMTPSDPGSSGKGYLLIGGALLGVGVPLIVYGVADPRDVYVRDKPRTVSVGMTSAAGGLGMRVNVTF